jgi:hypothetical protein
MYKETNDSTEKEHAGQFLCSYITLPLYALATQVYHIATICTFPQGKNWSIHIICKKILMHNLLVNKYHEQDIRST